MTHTLIEITEDEFDTSYPLRTNHLNPHASWAFGEAGGCLFETFGEELDFVRCQEPATVWTLVDGEDGDQYLLSGIHFVNRLGYLVSLIAVPEGVDIRVRLPMQSEESEATMTCTDETRSRTQHTPGPWDYRPDEDGKAITNGKIAIAYMDAYEPEEEDGGAWERETEANAGLITAAPALALLLEMLRYGVLTLSDGDAEFEGTLYAFDSSHPDWSTLVDTIGWDKARAAIATSTVDWRAA